MPVCYSSNVTNIIKCNISGTFVYISCKNMCHKFWVKSMLETSFINQRNKAALGDMQAHSWRQVNCTYSNKSLYFPFLPALTDSLRLSRRPFTKKRISSLCSNIGKTENSELMLGYRKNVKHREETVCVYN